MAPIYDKFARYYDRVFVVLEMAFLSKMRRRAFSHLPAKGTILEVGAGTGANFQFYGHDHSVVAIEISSKMAEYARKRGRAIKIVRGDAQSLPFHTNSFDAAVATLVFCSVPDPHLGFSEIMRVVRSGGTVVLLEHVRPPGFLGRVFDRIDRFTFKWSEDHFNRETAATAEAAGLRIISNERRFFGVLNTIVCEVP